MFDIILKQVSWPWRYHTAARQIFGGEKKRQAGHDPYASPRSARLRVVVAGYAAGFHADSGGSVPDFASAIIPNSRRSGPAAQMFYPDAAAMLLLGNRRHLLLRLFSSTARINNCSLQASRWTAGKVTARWRCAREVIIRSPGLLVQNKVDS